MSDNKLAETVRAGHEANSVLNNQAFKNAMLNAKATLVNKFVDSKPGDSEAREEAYLQLRAMSALFGELTDTIQSGTMAQTSLDEINKFNNENDKLK